jgi:hypothetical protein
MRIDREFYACPCGCKVHQSHFDRVETSVATERSKRGVALLASERVYVALAFLDELTDDGLIVDLSIRRKLADYVAAQVADHWAEALPGGGEAIDLDDSPF